MLGMLREDLWNKRDVIKQVKYFVYYKWKKPNKKSTKNKTGGINAMVQHIHSKIIAKIHEVVEAEISELPEVKCALKLYFTTLPQSPDIDDRA